MAEAGARGSPGRSLRALLHVQANEVVGDRKPPHLLADALGSAAAERLLALERVGLDLVEAKLELPALVVERGDLGGRIRLRVEQRGEQDLGLEAWALIAHGADLERLLQLTVAPSPF